MYERKDNRWYIGTIVILLLIIFLGGGGGYSLFQREITKQKEWEQEKIDSLNNIIEERDFIYEQYKDTINLQADLINRYRYEANKERNKRKKLEELVNDIVNNRYKRDYLDSIADNVRYK